MTKQINKSKLKVTSSGYECKMNPYKEFLFLNCNGSQYRKMGPKPINKKVPDVR